MTHFVLAATLALLGSLDQASAAVKAGFAINPGFTIRRLRDAAYGNNSAYLAKRERLYLGMRMAGVPKG